MRPSRAVLAGLGLVALLEAGLRYGVGLGAPPLVERHPQIEYQLVPAADYTRYGNRIGINSHRMRGPEHTAAAGPDARRVLLIGDSVVYGNHFLDQQETIALRLTGLLGEAPELSGCAPLAMAAAASSWGPVNQTAFLEQTGLLGAALAILIVSSHDLYDTPDFDASVIPYRLRPPVGAIGDAVEIVHERLARRLRSVPERPLTERRAETLAALERMHLLFRARNVPLVVLYHPTVTEQARGLRGEHDVFAAWAQARGRAFGVLELGSAGGDLYRDDIHPAAGGALAIARQLAQISRERLLPCAAGDRS